MATYERRSGAAQKAVDAERREEALREVETSQDGISIREEYEETTRAPVYEETTRAPAYRDELRVLRGGVTVWGVLTGVVVAFGAMFILGAIVGGVVATAGADATLNDDSALEIGIAAGVLFVLFQFLAYMWGGYTAGRMGRGAGVMNGMLVPVVALLIAAVTAVIVMAIGADARLNTPFTPARFAVDQEATIRFGIGLGIAGLVAMFAGGILGGLRGARWHDRLEAGRTARDGDMIARR